MTNRGNDRWHPHAIQRAIMTAELTLLLPLISAVVPLAMGARAIVVMACLGVATIASAGLCAGIALRADARVEQGQRILEAQRSEWESKALSDPLTAIANRRGIDARASYVEAHDDEVSWTVVAFDVDHFKTINDFHGHPVGDRALVLLADTLHEHCPDGAWVGRLGGDEFVAFTDAGGLLTERWAHELCAALGRRTLQTREGSIELSLTFGRTVGHPGQPFAEVCADADFALIKRKAGRRSSRSGVIGLTDAEVDVMRRRAESLDDNSRAAARDR
ncbi:MAG: GGDEF domain-containing protein [Actinobacteria bacterium]|nr:GGDEF domain-containing protein [Actinomycetota bacterium]